MGSRNPWTCELCGATPPALHADGCRFSTPTPPAPADDASGAEADAVERAAEAIYHADYFGGDTLPTLDYRKDAPFSAMAETTKAEYRLLARAAIRALPLTARDDAVEEAAKRAYIVHGRALSPFPTYDHGAEWDRRRQYDGDRVVALWMDIARAALRREKGGGK